MSEAKHTPGPWKWDGDDITPTVFRDHGQKVGGAICEVDAGKDSVANARLIASAPDLLAALQAAWPYLCENCEGYPVISTVRDAIAKATNG